MTSRVVILFCLCLTFTPLVHSNNCVVTTVYGCYVDTITPRTIPNQAAASGSQEECAQNCQAIGFTGTAGCENGQDCWCSSASGPLGEKTNNIECYMPCPDSPDQKCGGTSRLTEFSFTCGGSSNYACSGSTCVVDPSGPYSDPSCGGQCQAPSPPSPPPSPPTSGFVVQVYDKSQGCDMNLTNTIIYFFNDTQGECVAELDGTSTRTATYDGVYDVHWKCDSRCAVCSYNFYGPKEICFDIGGGMSAFAREEMCLGGATVPALKANDVYAAYLSNPDAIGKNGYVCSNQGEASYRQVRLVYGGISDGSCNFDNYLPPYDQVNVMRGSVVSVLARCRTSKCVSDNCTINFPTYTDQCFVGEFLGGEFLFGANRVQICADKSLV